jgi:hypothetical protein
MPTFTVKQVAAARAFLGWSQHELVSASGLSFESVRVTAKSVDAIRAAFHAAGVDFLDTVGRVGTTIVVQRQPW